MSPLSVPSSVDSQQHLSEVIAYHGWGFSAAEWSSWQPWLMQQGYDLKTFDRGYFGNLVEPSFSSTANSKVIFVHSYGLHLCPAEQLQQADALIIFASFSDFHPEPANLRKRSQQILQQMITQWQANPALVLENFKVKCYHPQPWTKSVQAKTDSKTDSGQFSDRLLQDLMHLNSSVLDLAVLQTIPRIVIFQGGSDRIVTPARGKALAQHLPTSQYFEIAAAGHALPFTHTEHCQTILHPLLKSLLQPA